MTDFIRVSCATLCRIEHHGRYFLLVNANRRAKGLYILSPIGGALALTDESRITAFGAVLDNPASRDLRLMLSRDRLPEFRAWFLRGEGRERTPYRELREELVEESKLLPKLDEHEITCRYLWTVEEESLTNRQGFTGLLTHYFLEIYDVRFMSSAALGPLLALPPESGAAWVTPDVIQARQKVSLCLDGEPREVMVNADILLRPPESAAGN